MKRNFAVSATVIVFLFAAQIIAQQPKPGVLGADDLRRVVPGAYFYAGQSASVQLRNSVGFAAADGKLVLAGLVDTSGYSTDVQAKYQGFFITEVKLSIAGSELAPGEYGFGFSKDGRFQVMDVADNVLLSVVAQADAKLARPRPLQLVADGDSYRLYAGRKWVTLKPE